MKIRHRAHPTYGEVLHLYINSKICENIVYRFKFSSNFNGKT